jgi:hypothetical protein
VYLKQQFYTDQKLCVQKKIICESWAQQGMETISAIIDFTPTDTSASKMWELVAPYIKDTTSAILLTKKAIVLGKL